MDRLDLGPLHVRRIVKANGTAPKSDERGPLTVVLMHGYGAPGDDLVALAEVIEAPRGTTFLFPEAPSKLAGPPGFQFGDARQWWPIDIGRLERAIQRGALDEELDKEPTGLATSRAQVNAMLDALERDHATTSARVVLGGFSQGSMLATDVTLRSSRPLAGLVVLSGTLVAAREWLPRMRERNDLPVFQSHGTEDPLLPFAIAEQLRRALESAGLRVTFRSFEGGHGIPPSVLRDLGVWLSDLA
jgi:phospholipase/carboxylesterase